MPGKACAGGLIHGYHVRLYGHTLYTSQLAVQFVLWVGHFLQPAVHKSVPWSVRRS
jgi:hypothetical protein